jgi:hypothetical protein
MTGTINLLKVGLALYMLTILSCRTEDSTNMRTVFEKAAKNDSLAYYFHSILNDTFKRKDPDFQDFEQKWYSSSLYSFKEPILYTKTDSQTIYRLLWLRSFHEPVCFSIKELRGDHFLNTKILDRQSAFYPEIQITGKNKKTGKEILDTIKKADRYAVIVFDSITTLTARQWKQIENSLNRLNFWASSYRNISPGVRSSDGSDWILEGRKLGNYHFIIRTNLDDTLRELGKSLIKLSGLTVSERNFY